MIGVEYKIKHNPFPVSKISIEEEDGITSLVIVQDNKLAGLYAFEVRDETDRKVVNSIINEVSQCAKIREQ